MRSQLPWMLALGPSFAVAYFLRVNDSSFYIFDPYSLILLLVGIKFVPRRRLIGLLGGCALFIVITTIGLFGTIISFDQISFDKFSAGLLRYTQLIIITYILISIGRSRNFQLNEYTIRLFLISICFPLVSGLLLLWTHPETVLVFDRFSSYLSNPNNLGAFICIAIPTVNYLVQLLKGKYWRLILGMGFHASAIVSLFYAGSNSAWSLCAVALIISAASMRNRFSRYLFPIIIILSSAIFFAILFQDWLLSSEIKGLRNTGHLISVLRGDGQFMDLGSGHLRESLVRDVWEMYLSSPFIMLFGIGLGQSPGIIGGSYGANITAHNAFLVLLLECGLIGCAVLGFLLVNAIHLTRAKHYATPVISGYLLAMLGTPHVYLPFLWAPVSYGLYVISITENRKNPRQKEQITYSISY